MLITVIKTLSCRFQAREVLLVEPKEVLPKRLLLEQVEPQEVVVEQVEHNDVILCRKYYVYLVNYFVRGNNLLIDGYYGDILCCSQFFVL